MIILRNDEKAQRALASYIARKCGSTYEKFVGGIPYYAIGFATRGKPAGAVLFNNYRHPDIHVHWAGEPGWLTKGHIKAIFDYPFNQLKCERVTALIDKANKASRVPVEKLGFRYEGNLRKSQKNGNDTIVYGMLKSECKWIDQ